MKTDDRMRLMAEETIELLLEKVEQKQGQRIYKHGIRRLSEKLLEGDLHCEAARKRRRT